MSLYDDLGVATSDAKTEGWSKNFKLLQSQLKVKKAALTQAKTQRMRQSTVLAPVIDLKRGSAGDDRQISDTPPHVAAGLKDSAPAGFSAGDVLIPLADEYDPMFPNDYEKVVKRHREEQQRQREQEPHVPHVHIGVVMSVTLWLYLSSVGMAASYSYDEEGRQRSKAAIPPPIYEDSERPRSPPGPTSSFLANMGGTVAHKIMQKYGFREGQGLGKHEQGLSTALSVEKTSKRGGKIIIGDSTEKTSGSSQNVTDTPGSNSGASDTSKKNEVNPLTEILKCPTKVVLLRNMVGRGEVDEDLEAETKEECEKYGKVVKCVIFEISDVADDEAVRIFLEFERVESAIKAVVDLNGRYFGGRVVKACFYNLDKFRVLDLGEQV
uniref:Splicing factor 45 n=1 Tax=Pygocentrus nattereri TaxID=42514 RepID=A0AAR2JML2_PYGNA